MKKIELSKLSKHIDGINLKNLEGRIDFQKSIYLLKEMNIIKEKFSFSWYIFGPYSSHVTKIGYDLKERNIDTEIKISDDFETKIKNFNNMKNEGKDKSKWLELLSSIHFLLKNEKLDDEKLYNKIKESKPYFEDKKLFEKGRETIKSNFNL